MKNKKGDTCGCQVTHVAQETALKNAGANGKVFDLNLWMLVNC